MKPLQLFFNVFSNIIQQFYSTGVVPANWKTANVVPILKKGDLAKPANYQPVLLTSVVSKMLEHIVVSNIMRQLDPHNILKENQHSFWQKRYCETQLLLTADDLFKHINSGKHVDMAILDFINYLTTFHTNTYYFWILRNMVSYKTVDCLFLIWAYPKGSGARLLIRRMTGYFRSTPRIFQPCLFLLYINDIADNISSTICLFADDCFLISLTVFPPSFLLYNGRYCSPGDNN